MKPKDQALEVWGDFACFTRPEMKAERFSYPVITPSAARGIFDAIYCKPDQFRWQITSIQILSPPSYIALRRNEVNKYINTNNFEKKLQSQKTPVPIVVDSNVRAQRQTMALKDVKYCLHAEIRPWPEFADRIQDLEAQFRRRASKGKCFYQPYFGCREFPAYFRLMDPHEDIEAADVSEIDDIGWMVYDVFDLSSKGSNTSKPCISLFRPRIANGEMAVPPYESGEVLKPDQGGYDASSS